MKPPTPSRTFSRSNRPTPRAIRLAARAWISFLIVFSLQPLRLRAIAFGKPLHPLLHAFVFGLAAALVLMRSAKPSQRLIRTSGILLMAAALETAQSTIYGFRMEWRDFWSDTLGVLIAVVAIGVSVRVSKQASS